MKRPILLLLRGLFLLGSGFSETGRKPGVFSLVRKIWLLLAISAVIGTAAWAQSSVESNDPNEIPLPDAIVNRLPADWQPTVRKYATTRGGSENHWANMKDDQLRTSMLSLLSFREGAEEFVIDHLTEAIPNKDLLVLVHNLYHQKHWWNHTRIDPVLEKMTVAIPDQEIAIECLEATRKLEMQRLRQSLDKRLDAVRTTAKSEDLTKLEQEDERWISLVNGTMLPAFLRRVPPIFSVGNDKPKIRVLAFGDFGSQGLKKEWDHQRETAAAMREYAQAHPFDFGITLGDNFYPEGMESPDQPRWKTDWEALYGPLGIPFFAAFGNHDWYGSDSPAAEILHGSHSPSWHMPAPYYTYMAGAAQFFAIDTNEISAAQATWLKNALKKSQAKWKVVYGHFPPYIAGPQGRTRNENTIQALMPLLRGMADVYLAGHHHSLEHLKPVDGVNLFIAGGGGAVSYEVDPASPVALFAKQTYGFAVLEIDEHNFTVRFIEATGKQLYETTLRK